MQISRFLQYRTAKKNSRFRKVISSFPSVIQEQQPRDFHISRNEKLEKFLIQDCPKGGGKTTNFIQTSRTTVLRLELLEPHYQLGGSSNSSLLIIRGGQDRKINYTRLFVPEFSHVLLFVRPLCNLNLPMYFFELLILSCEKLLDTKP